MIQIHSHLKFQQNHRTSPTENLHPTRKDLTRHKHGRPKISTRIILTSSNPTFESTSNSPFKISNSTRDDDRSDLPVSILSERDWQMEGSLSKSSNREGLHGQHHDTVLELDAIPCPRRMLARRRWKRRSGQKKKSLGLNTRENGRINRRSSSSANFPVNQRKPLFGA